jgi:hypothetical protein
VVRAVISDPKSRAVYEPLYDADPRTLAQRLKCFRLTKRLPSPLTRVALAGLVGSVRLNHD